MKTKEAKLFMNGRSQAVRLPKEFRLPGKAVYIQKEGDRVVLIPKKRRTWDAFFDACGKFTDDFMAEGRDQGIQEERESF